MADRWTVYSRDKTFGPWSAQQVREEMRAGKIDPFDMVSKEGSSIKRPLVEVDEIFHNSRVQMGEIIQDKVSDRYSQDIHKSTVVSSDKTYNDSAIAGKAGRHGQRGSSIAHDGGAAQNLSQSDLRPRQFQALAAENRVDAHLKRSGSRRRYAVIDATGSIRSPLSSSEIIELWNSGSIDSQAQVRREGGEKKISIQRFLSLYKQTNASGIAFLSNVQTRLPRYIMAKRSNLDRVLILIGVVAISMALALLAIAAYQYGVEKKWIKRTSMIGVGTPTQVFDLKANEDLAVSVPLPKQIEAGDSAEPTSNVNATNDITPGSVSNSQLNLGNRIQSGSKSQFQKSKAKAQNKQTKTIRRTNSNTKLRSVEPKPSPKFNAQQRSMTPSTGNRVKESASMPSKLKNDSTSSIAPKSVGSFAEGSTVAVSGYSFNPGLLAGCSGKCKISMQGPQGAITVIFFKDAWGPVFTNKSKGLKLSGIMRRMPSGGWQMILSQAQ
ncbi:MAG: hypothetical protein NT027_15375 [Proteobacteria bacterium]|nr:hypothetical protein [Pseudomonadota bacterium]